MNDRDFSYRVARLVRIDDLQLDETAYGASSPQVPRHFHERGLIALVVRGSLMHETRGRRTNLVAGNVVCLPPGEPHAVSLPNAARVFSLEVGADWLTDIAGSSGFPVDRLRAREQWLAGAAVRLYHRFIGAPNEPRVDLEELAIAMFAAPMDLRTRSRTRTPRTVPTWIRRARELVADRACESLRLSVVAREVGVHPVTLSRTFRSSYGVTMSAFLQERRLELASTALATSDLPVAAIALTHGFADHAHFSRTFRRSVGMTPSAFRAALGRRARHGRGADAARERKPVVTFRASDARIFVA